MTRNIRILIVILLLGALLAAGACATTTGPAGSPTSPTTTTTSATSPTTQPATETTSPDVSPPPTSTPDSSPSTPATSKPPARPIAGFSAPGFRLESTDGLSVSLASLEGHPVVLNFWATWCGPCRHEIPFLQDLATDPAWLDRGLEMVAIDIQESEADVRQFMESFGMTYPVLLDRSGQVANLYNIRGIPTTFFIDKDGIIQNVRVGTFSSKGEIETIIEQAIITD
jgi:cytochrome c biogenesis protein CcmG/thiol:disulfide interchange protein DsbE